MQVDFVRHGIAVDRARGMADRERPLTPKGRQRTAVIAQILYRRGDRWDAILTSPLLRAQQTAEILQAAQLAPELVEFPPLEPGGDFRELASWSQTHPQQERIAVVGHQPDLGHWIELALWGEAKGCLQLKKAGVGRVDFPAGRLRLGAGILLELLAPKTLLLAAAPFAG
jgi:phosphohistidine phosphatase